MQAGAITGYIDVAQLVLYAFWIFFAGLIYHLHRENKREGYPLESDRSGSVTVQGWPPIPKPKTYLLADGSTVSAPHQRVANQPPPHEGAYRGSAMQPSGDLMLAGVGPGSWNDRADVPGLTYEGLIKIVPLRAAEGLGVAPQDVDPRGLPVIGGDGLEGGRVVDLWVDRSEMLFRYLEVEVPAEAGARRVLLPMNFARVEQRQIRVKSIFSHHFARVPATRAPEQVTLLEEEKIMAYYGAGILYATPSRQEPLL